MNQDTPLISCLMVTANRPHLARRAVHCLAEQTWPNIELVIVDDGDMSYEPILEPYRDRFQITYKRVEKQPETYLGALRNLTLEAASGDYCAQWDDDEWYHPERLEQQLTYLRENDLSAVTLREVLVHLDDGEFSAHPFRFDSVDGTCGTILHERNSFRYPNLPRSEDLAFLELFQAAGRAGVLPSPTGHLFIRCYHGANTWDKQHFLNKIRKTFTGNLEYLFFRYIVGDLFRHRNFRLNETERAAFKAYLADTEKLGISRCG